MFDNDELDFDFDTDFLDIDDDRDYLSDVDDAGMASDNSDAEIEMMAANLKKELAPYFQKPLTNQIQ